MKTKSSYCEPRRDCRACIRSYRRGLVCAVLRVMCLTVPEGTALWPPTVRMRAVLWNRNCIPAASVAIFPRSSCFTGQRGSMNLLPSTAHLLKHKPDHVIVLLNTMLLTRAFPKCNCSREDILYVWYPIPPYISISKVNFIIERAVKAHRGVEL